VAANFDPLPITQTLTPASQAELADAVRQCHDRDTPLYPVGGATALDFGLTPKRPGAALSLAGLQTIVDYPARDMTVTVEAGMRVAELVQVLAREGQQWPIDVPRADNATVGGVIATNANGPRRYGYGSVRDYVIGISAVDGTGRPFKGGGRVVKNVAGYDFCKLLTGSLGTLGVLTQATLRLRPLPETSAWRGCVTANLETLDRLLDSLAASRTSPVAIETLAGPAWTASPRLAPLNSNTARNDSSQPASPASPASPGSSAGATTGALGSASGSASSYSTPFFLLVRFEGSEPEVTWQLEQVAAEWRTAGVADSHVWRGEDADGWLRDLAEFPQSLGTPSPSTPSPSTPSPSTPSIGTQSTGTQKPTAQSPGAALVVQASVRPSGTVPMFRAFTAIDPRVSLLGHAGNGIVVARFAEFPAGGLSRTLVGRAQPEALRFDGSVKILSNPSGQEMAPHTVWGAGGASFDVMMSVKRQFDPRHVLNPGRFIFPAG
jgi:glycolate oxidase FAD binding subunit